MRLLACGFPDLQGGLLDDSCTSGLVGCCVAGFIYLVAEFINIKQCVRFQFYKGSYYPKNLKCSNSATKYVKGYGSGGLRVVALKGLRLIEFRDRSCKPGGLNNGSRRFNPGSSLR